MQHKWIPALFLLTLAGCGAGGGGNETTSLAPATTTSVFTSAPPGVMSAQTVVPPPPPTPVDLQLRAAMARNGITAAPVAPPQAPAEVALGEALFFDKILSGGKSVACATCHQPSKASTDGLSTSLGSQGAFLPRNAPPLWNRSSVETFFLDGRVSGNPARGFATPAGASLPAGLSHALAAQAMFPVTVPEEMLGVATPDNEVARLGGSDQVAIWSLLLARLQAIPEYVRLFQAAYPDVPPNQLGFQHAANAMAAYEMARFSPLNSPFDHYLAGDDTALDDSQKRGALLFYGRARCAVCHRGPLLSDLSFHNIGFPQVGPGKGAEAPLDLGRGRETNLLADRFRFATPILRNVALTGPWTHAGGYTTLGAVVRHYINPAQSLRNYNPAQLDPRFQNQVHVQEQIAAGVLNTLDPDLVSVPLNPNEVNDLVAFLGSLTDPGALTVPAPTRVPSGLPVGP